MEFTVMTYNIQSGRNLAQDRNIAHAISAIQKENPDILSLNEVQHCTELCPEGKCQAQAVAEALGYPYFHFGRSLTLWEVSMAMPSCPGSPFRKFRFSLFRIYQRKNGTAGSSPGAICAAGWI